MRLRSFLGPGASFGLLLGAAACISESNPGDPPSGTPLSDRVEHLRTDGTWESLAPMPATLANQSATLLPGSSTIIVAGGLRGDDGPVDTTTQVYSYDVAGDDWTLIGNLDEPRDFHQAVVLDSQHILFYGSAQGGVSHEVFSLLDASSTPTINDPQLFSPALAALPDGGVLLVSGNPDWDDEGGTDEVWRLDPTTLAWRELAPLETALDFAVLARLGDGRVAFIGADHGFFQVQIFDPASETWTDAPPTLAIESWMVRGAIATSDDRLLIFGTAGGGNSRIEVLASPAGPGSESWTDVTPADSGDLVFDDTNPGVLVALSDGSMARVFYTWNGAGPYVTEVARFTPNAGEVHVATNGPDILFGQRVAAHPDGGVLLLGGKIDYDDPRQD